MKKAMRLYRFSEYKSEKMNNLLFFFVFCYDTGMKRKAGIGLLIISLTGLFLSAGIIFYQKYDAYQSQNLYTEMQTMFTEPALEKKSEEELRLEKYASLHEQNPDMIGWIRIEGTHIDYPVMQRAGDNEYYLRRNFNEDYSFLGTPFLDIRSTLSPASDNWLIYGHNSLDEQMFSELLKYKDAAFYEKHPTIQFDLIDELQTFEIIAVFQSQVFLQEENTFKYYQFFDAQNEAEMNDFLQNIKALSLYEIKTEASYGDQLLTLSTCRFDAENGRFVVVAKKIEQ